MAFFKSLRNHFNDIYVSGVMAIYKTIKLTSFRFHWGLNKDQRIPGYFSNGGGTIVIHDNLMYVTTDVSGLKLYAWNGKVWIDRGQLPQALNDTGSSSSGDIGDLLSFRGSMFFYKGKKRYTKNFEGGRGWVEKENNPYTFKYTKVIAYHDHLHCFGGTNSDSDHQKHYIWDGDTIGWEASSSIPKDIFNSGNIGLIVHNDKIHIIGYSDSKIYHYTWDDTSWALASEFTPFDSSNRLIKGCFEDKDGSMYIYTEKKLYRYIDETQTWLLIESNFIGNYIRDCVITYEDKTYRLSGYDVYESAMAYKLEYGD